MIDAPTPLRYPETPQPEDSALAQASHSHVAGNRALQLIAELIAKLRGSRFSWWTPELLRGTWNAGERMAWFRQRPDIRQRITCGLTGLRPKAARDKQPDFQGALIDSVIDAGDVTVNEFENAFDAIELAAYAPAALIWRRFCEQMPWDDNRPTNQELVAWLVDRLLASSSTIEGMTREPILTPHAIRTTIPGKIWHSKIPLEIRAAIDESRFALERENPREPFHAIHDLSIATPAIIAANIPLRDLLCVLDAAEKAMALPPSREVPAAAPPLKTAAAAIVEPPKADVKSQPAISPAEKMRERTAEAAEAEPAAPAAVPLKLAEIPAEKALDRWERMANKVLEKVGKEAGTTEESRNANR